MVSENIFERWSMQFCALGIEKQQNTGFLWTKRKQTRFFWIDTALVSDKYICYFKNIIICKKRNVLFKERKFFWFVEEKSNKYKTYYFQNDISAEELMFDSSFCYRTKKDQGKWCINYIIHWWLWVPFWHCVLKTSNIP